MYIDNSEGRGYLNFNTGYLTSNPKNARFKTDDAGEFLVGKLRPVESLEDIVEAGYNLANRTYIDSANNSLYLAKGETVNLKGGWTIMLTDRGFQFTGAQGKEAYWQDASETIAALNQLLRHAGGTISSLALGVKNYQEWEEHVRTALSTYFGIDTSKPFYINGMRYSRNSEGEFESQREADAKKAYELQYANNQTYEYADEPSKRRMEYLTDYYLETAPSEVRDLWRETMKETGVNPFSQRAGFTIGQLAMEQDFATGGNDQLFGNTVESSIEAVNKILERIDNPLGTITEEKQIDLQEEREFYTAFLEKLKNLAAS